MAQKAKYRHELKYAIGPAQYLPLRQALRTICQPDVHAGPDGQYHIISLYFDNCADKALREKRHGAAQREKFRLRYYDDDTSLIKLEKKQKRSGLCLKLSETITEAECRRLLSGDWRWIFALTATASNSPSAAVIDVNSPNRPLLTELAFKMETQLLRPRTVVRYNREPYIYPIGNVRITFDKAICGGLSAASFLDRQASTVPAALSNSQTDGFAAETMIMEIKYDEFLPALLADILQPACTRLQAFSKYAQCRNYEL